MTWEETLALLQEGLRSELRKRWGHIGAIEARAGLRRGDLSEWYSGRKRVQLDVFLKSLDAVEVDHGSFFSRALGAAHPKPEEILDEFLGVGKGDVTLAKIERATRQLEAAEPRAVDPAAIADGEDIAEVARCSLYDQQRRLRYSRKYRTRAFASAYLKHLDSLRYDDAEAAAKLAATVAIDLVPSLPGPRSNRFALQCLALGIFGSARRVKARFPAAARAFQLALELSRRHKLLEENAEALQRASYLLRDFGQFERALDILREALVIYVDLESRTGIGKTLVDRGMMLSFLGDFEATVVVLRQALRYLEGHEAVSPRNRFAAYQFLAYAFENLGQLEAAERLLEESMGIPGLEQGFYWAKLRWLQGSLAFKCGHHAKAENMLMAARDALASSENAGQQALVSVDLLDALLAQGKLEEACELAKDMARLLDSFETNPLAQQAIVKLIRPALAGRLTRTITGEVRAALEGVRAPGRSADLSR